jgi:hypothetical protein
MWTALQNYVDQEVDRTDFGYRTVTAAKDGTVKDTNHGKLGTQPHFMYQNTTTPHVPEHNHTACTRT